jgi:CobQ/CobB/MinD/ParA nucleotide binding domain
MSEIIFFNEALQKAADIVLGVSLPEGVERPLLVRDIQGRISIALNFPRSEHVDIVSELGGRTGALGAFAAAPSVVCSDDFFDAPALFHDPAVVQFAVPGTEQPVLLLDRQVTGQDWLLNTGNAGSSPGQFAVPRLIFFGLKGGVGRSTALAILAYELARSGKRVLLIDLDLESPGLSGLLLPSDRVARFGVVDWLVEDAVGQGADVCEQIVSASPLSENLRYEIRVVSAAGNNDLFYLDKLSRAYGDVSKQHEVRRFSERVRDLVEILEGREKPDVVLIDSRAGLHDLAALSIGLASTAFLFATDAAQCWQGYRSLFVHWQSRPEVARRVRERLRMVSALFPETDQAARARRFLERSHVLFTETLYDEVAPGGTEVGDADFFNFDIENSSAPHYPFRIKWSNRFQEFDPLEITRGLFSEDDIRGAYGEFVDGVVQLVEGAEA